MPRTLEPTRRRLIRRAAVAAAFGLVITLALASWLASRHVVTVRTGRDMRQPPEFMGLDVTRGSEGRVLLSTIGMDAEMTYLGVDWWHPEPGVSRVAIQVFHRKPPADAWEPVPATWPTTETAPPAWSDARNLAVSMAADPFFLDSDRKATFETPYATEIAAGWPFRALRGRLTVEGHADPVEVERAWCLALEVPPPNGTSFPGLLEQLFGKPYRVYPMRPIALGLTLDVLFFGLLLLVPWEARGLVRRARRRHRGLCPTCAYDRTNLPDTNPCPECGTAPK